MLTRVLWRLLREPLVHFAVIGGMMFVVYSEMSEPASQPATRILVESQRVEQLRRAYQAVWRRPPDAAETGKLIDDFVREEIYYREALVLGLDRDDTVIRRRLRQKMEFLTDTGADRLEPAAGELEAFLTANEGTYRKLPQIAFEQVFLGQNPARELVDKSLGGLQSHPAADLSELGERSLLPPQLGLSSPTVVDGVFGRNFFQQLETQPPGQWSGPVTSGYGVHLVRVVEKTLASTPLLDEIRDHVLRDWKAAKAQELHEQWYARLKEQYTVEVIDATDPANGKP